jgi:hypothetical protein
MGKVVLFPESDVQARFFSEPLDVGLIGKSVDVSSEQSRGHFDLG